MRAKYKAARGFANSREATSGLTTHIYFLIFTSFCSDYTQVSMWVSPATRAIPCAYCSLKITSLS